MITARELINLVGRLEKLTQEIKELKSARAEIRAKEAEFTDKIDAKQAEQDEVIQALTAAGVSLAP